MHDRKLNLRAYIRSYSYKIRESEFRQFTSPQLFVMGPCLSFIHWTLSLKDRHFFFVVKFSFEFSASQTANGIRPRIKSKICPKIDEFFRSRFFREDKTKFLWLWYDDANLSSLMILKDVMWGVFRVYIIDFEQLIQRKACGSGLNTRTWKI